MEKIYHTVHIEIFLAMLSRTNVPPILARVDWFDFRPVWIQLDFGSSFLVLFAHARHGPV